MVEKPNNFPSSKEQSEYKKTLYFTATFVKLGIESQIYIVLFIYAACRRLISYYVLYHQLVQVVQYLVSLFT